MVVLLTSKARHTTTLLRLHSITILILSLAQRFVFCWRLRHLPPSPAPRWSLRNQQKCAYSCACKHTRHPTRRGTVSHRTHPLRQRVFALHAKRPTSFCRSPSRAEWLSGGQWTCPLYVRIAPDSVSAGWMITGWFAADRAGLRNGVVVNYLLKFFARNLSISKYENMDWWVLFSNWNTEGIDVWRLIALPESVLIRWQAMHYTIIHCALDGKMHANTCHRKCKPNQNTWIHFPQNAEKTQHSRHNAYKLSQLR